MLRFKEFIQEGNPLSRIHTFGDVGRHFVGISAERSHLSPEENTKRVNNMKSLLQAHGYGYRQTKGEWEGGSERSFIVHAKAPGDKAGHELLADMKRMGEKFDQDAILHHDGKEAKLIGTNSTGYPGKDQVQGVGKVAYNNPDSPFQTKFKKGQKFTTK